MTMAEYAGPMTIGEFIDRLERAPVDYHVVFDFGRLAPTRIKSWRGIYAEAAIGYAEAGPPTVRELLLELYGSVDGRTYRGYKGGEYSFDRNTPLHVDNYGEYSHTEIADVRIGNYDVMLVTTNSELFE